MKKLSISSKLLTANNIVENESSVRPLLVRDSGSCSSIALSSSNLCHAFDRTKSSAFDSRVLKMVS